MNNLFRRRPYFEGWYFKHQVGNKVLAFIPGISREKGGELSPFLQIIAGTDSFCLTFSQEDCFIDRKACYIRLGKNVFTKDGIMIDISTAGLKLKGILLYCNLHPIAYSIMGFFRYFPFMECKHEVISMSHSVSGDLVFNKESLSFDKGIGYIEKDWGHSFPSSYLWLQCNDFEKEACSFMLSIAHIPLWGTEFTGCICAIQYKGKEYRFATYHGVRILKASPSLIILRQGDYLLKIKIQESPSRASYDLNAPSRGQMNRIIKEAHLCTGIFILKYRKQYIFRLRSSQLSLESVSDGTTGIS